MVQYSGLRVDFKSAASQHGRHMACLVQVDLPRLQKVIQAARSGDHKTHACPNVCQLTMLWCTAVHAPAAANTNCGPLLQAHTCQPHASYSRLGLAAITPACAES